VSNEPSLGKVNWRGWEGLINWMVSGGESGPKARPTHPDAIRADRDWCVANGVPFFFKQWGQFDYRRIIKNTVGTCIETPNGYVTINAAGITPLDDRYAAVRVADKHRAGNELDGQTWAQFPPLPSGSLTLPPSVEHALRERS
jgi:protein gp37